MIDLARITTPTLLLDAARARANIARMAARAAKQGIRFRPHFKTHQSAAVGEWFRAVGVRAITVSSVRMADYFADAGWNDMTIAFPVNVRELPAITQLAARVHLGLLVDSVAAVNALGAALTQPAELWLEVDTGYQRSGLPAADVEGALGVLHAARAWPNLHVQGLLTHTGQSYAVQGKAALTTLYAQTLGALQQLRAALAAAGFPNLALSIGDTPTCSVVDDLGMVNEMRPGNFIFYDWMQYTIGACSEQEIAVAVACPVVAVYPARREVILYGGAVHLSKEFVRSADGAPDYGHAAALTATGWGTAWPGVHLRSLSQEHGILHAADAHSFNAHLGACKVGDLVAVLPIHSCLTADLLKRYTLFDGASMAMMGERAQG